MNGLQSGLKRNTTLAAIVLLAIGGVLAWYLASRPRAGDERMASSDVVAQFNVGLAALDVEENERALKMFGAAVELEEREPALWADLAVAQLRLDQLPEARESLEHALRLLPESRDLMLLNAETLAHSGEVELAIEHLRKLHQNWPENIAATYFLASLLGQLRSEEADVERLQLFSDILGYAPANLQALTEQARVAASLQDEATLQAALDTLQKMQAQWPEKLLEQLTSASKATQERDFRRAALALTFFQNLLKPRPEYQQSLAQLGKLSSAAVGTPIRGFLWLTTPPIEAAEADFEIAFEFEKPTDTGTQPDRVLALVLPGKTNPSLVLLAGDRLHVGTAAPLPFPGATSSTSSTSLCLADLNFDFFQDIVAVGEKGLVAYLGKEDGTFHDQPISVPGNTSGTWHGVWSSDIDADGDMDLLISDRKTALRWIRNNGDMTFVESPEFIAASGVFDVEFADFDSDGDIDLVTLNDVGALTIWRNQRNGLYTAEPLRATESRVTMAVGDVNRDGQFDLLSMTGTGSLLIAVAAANGSWTETSLGEWPHRKTKQSLTPSDDVLLAIADLDNNGAVDVMASAAASTELWMGTPAGKLEPLSQAINMTTAAIVDMNEDGLLDLVGRSASQGNVAWNRSAAGYGWQVVQPVANPNTGDKRINSFGIGGRVDIRAGNVVQASTIVSPRVHFGLGKHKQADLVRIVWPNGTSQAEFDFTESGVFVANQRLKGSCPWIFTYDGQEYRFVKDFIWRSPLGLRINAQTTAGVMQTEDWIKLEGENLVAHDGHYSIRITAELWETHFFDHVSLLAVDHPSNVSVLVDERFVPNEKPENRVLVATHPQPLMHVKDHRGRSLDAPLRTNDGVYGDQFELGSHQGVAEEHWLEFTVPPEGSGTEPVLIIGRGWIYPTDSSLNVALAQGNDARPFGLVLEQQNSKGDWQTIKDNLGFPAGKNKEIAIEIPPRALTDSRTFRLRTNMEIYWDSLLWANSVTGVEPRVVRLNTQTADLRYRGYSRLKPLDRRRPDTAYYEVAATGQQWLDLEGYYTRFGDVRELLAKIDDRYVIMNAGDELHLDFVAGAQIEAGWQRDFILIGDGWVKDGDFNTTYSQTVEPLPDHSDTEYGPLTPLDNDPVYRRHEDDWKRYHTRYVTPRQLNTKLWKSVTPLTTGDTQ